jgi:D-alanyl-D-alanine dipeptidase
MTRAAVDMVRPDQAAAVEFIKQARRQLHSAGVAGVDAESAGHAVLIGEARAQLRGDESLFDRLDRMRRTRHRVFYDIEEVSRLELESAMRDAGAVIDHAARFVLAQSTG